MHGLSWYLPLEPSGVVGPLQLPINWLEFLAIYGKFVIFGTSVPLLHSRAASSVWTATRSSTSRRSSGQVSRTDASSGAQCIGVDHPDVVVQWEDTERIPLADLVRCERCAVAPHPACAIDY